jgi:hypothetical protein
VKHDSIIEGKRGAAMKNTLSTLFLAVVATLGFAKAGNSENKPVNEKHLQERSSTPTVLLGEDAKMTVQPSERDRLRKFYGDVLGCQVIEKSATADLIRLANNFYIGVVYDNSALRDSDFLKSVWLEIRADHPEAEGFKFWNQGNQVLGQRTLLFSGSGRTSLSFDKQDRRHVQMAAVGWRLALSDLAAGVPILQGETR